MFSLRGLFGEVEPYSCEVAVEKIPSKSGREEQDGDSVESGRSDDQSAAANDEAGQPQKGLNNLTQSRDDDFDQDPATMIVKCPTESVPAVRAALTMITLPPYMTEAQGDDDDAVVYRFDVLRVTRN